MFWQYPVCFLTNFGLEKNIRKFIMGLIIQLKFVSPQDNTCEVSGDRSYIEINPKQIINLNVRSKIIKLVEEHMNENFAVFDQVKISSIEHQKHETLKKNDNWIKKHFHFLKYTIMT